MRFSRILLAVVIFVSGVAVGWVGSGSRPSAAPAGPVDFTKDIVIYDGPPPARVLRPHSVSVDGQSRSLGPAPASAPVGLWVISFDGGRVQIACSEFRE